MPLTESGKKVMGSMKKQYGERKEKEVFYASINKGKPGSTKWHAGGKHKHGKKVTKYHGSGTFTDEHLRTGFLKLNY